MAEIIPALSSAVLARMTAGEKRFALRLKNLLEDDYLCWFDIPVGRERRYPDFIILHPARGLLFLEVKDWKASTLKRLNKQTASLLVNDKPIEVANPLEQARQYMLQVVNLLSRDPQLLQSEDSRYQGKLCFPYAWGTVLTNINRQQITNNTTDAQREAVLPDNLVIYKDEMLESTNAEVFQQRLWGMFNHRFPNKLTVPQIDRIRWHLFPEVRISLQQDMFAMADNADSDELICTEDDDSSPPLNTALPDIVRIMDIQQEKLARSLGAGHRVIHGVAGSGKTLILGYRCELLAATSSKPVLVLCFNITLARKLNALMLAKGLEHRVQALHFHDWCKRQLNTYQVNTVAGPEPVWERQVESVIQGVAQGHIPRAQYGALLIDEGHDFEAEWLTLLVQMIDPESDSLLLLYDDAQSIYQKRSGLGFSLSSVGVKAQGRTTILRRNYRNTREILAFAYQFAERYICAKSSDDDHIPVLAPESAGRSGPVPVVTMGQHWLDEMAHAVAHLQRWKAQCMRWNEMAVLYVTGQQGSTLASYLKRSGIPCVWLASQSFKFGYDPQQDKVAVMAIPSSKGLEFPAVVVMGSGELSCDDEQLVQSARWLYVGMTRAQSELQLTCSKNTPLVAQLQASETSIVDTVEY
ncbi:3'-5' exonuclease [Oceanobacter sp. 4_MG-2023]|uniref:3'-5' exonuclease n=1 Tax=Oceanobacter sp. 4_MG-2023 TaxID=3062623 RepID=UPI002734F8FF|nr:3'-5' exonuclease [Oceanobacter sp. 4_MG-2023]MDP2549447.1 3'-5' exonuclease [Oceanobacter sp. 4_MG-2023]